MFRVKLHDVEVGETRYTIAIDNKIQCENLSLYNPDVVWEKLNVGNKVKIPPKDANISGGDGDKPWQKYILKDRDTGRSIARDLRIVFDDLRMVNLEKNLDVLKEGDQLRIPSNELEMYIVKDGDTGEHIADNFGIKFNELFKLNPNTIWEKLEKGDYLRIPYKRSKMYAVKNGDNKEKIAKALKIQLKELLNLNPNTNWSDLQPKDWLRVPH